MIKVGIFGASGYAGRELTKILNRHSQVDISFITSESHKDMKFSDLYKEFKGDIDKILISSKEAEKYLSSVDCVFLSLPHGKGFEILKMSLDLGKKVIDLSGNFRLDDKDDYEKWYKFIHPYPNLLNEKIYGLCEINHSAIMRSSLISNPGCYPTSIILGLFPLIKYYYDDIDLSSIIIDSKSGVSGAGKSPNSKNIFCEAGENITPYGIGSHRHLPEIIQEISKANKNKIDNVTFVPHLVPYQRGILSTIYIKCKVDSVSEIINKYKEFYSNSKLVKIVDEPVQVKWAANSNKCFINISFDTNSKTIVITSAIDNLLKGAAGQAVQNFNLMYGFDESCSLI